MNNSIPERFIFQCALFKNLEREVFMTHGYVDSHIIDQALCFLIMSAISGVKNGEFSLSILDA